MAQIKTTFQQDLEEVSIPDLSSLEGQQILITGATGLIGSALVDLLCLYAPQYHLHIYAGCRSEQKFIARFGSQYPFLHFIQLDVTMPVHSDIHFDVIIHAASGATPVAFSSDPVGVMKANLIGTIHLLDYGIAHQLKRFVCLSSGEVYGEGCQGKWQESDSGYVDSMSMRACYPSSKRAAETLCAAYASQYDIDTMVARMSHTYGPNFTPVDNRVYAQFIRNVLRGEDIVLKSKGEQYRSWLYVVDCVAALLYILVKGKRGEAYNVANDESNITICQLAELIAEQTGRKVVLDIPDDASQGNTTPITKAVFDTTKLESLGWKPRFDIRRGLADTIASASI
jgi:nucleoside-diphosphate-sugar epimerase